MQIPHEAWTALELWPQQPLLSLSYQRRAAAAGSHCELITSSLRGTTGRPHWVLLLQVSPYSRQGAGRPP